MSRFIYVFLLAFAACATLPGRLEPPKLTLAGISLIEAGLFEQRFNLRLRVQNPNDVDLPIQGLTYEVELNDKPFGSGVANKPVTVGKFGSEVLEVEMISNLSGFLRQLNELSKSGKPTLRYRLRGSASVGPYGTRLPFQQTGEVSLARFKDSTEVP